MKVDRVIIIRRARDEVGLKWVEISKLFKVSVTRIRQIYFNTKKDRFLSQPQKEKD